MIDRGQGYILNLMRTGELLMQKWRCIVCDYVYEPENGDPDSGIVPGTPFEELPLDWMCPICGAGKDQFEPVP